jgi:hypothetical protein
MALPAKPLDDSRAMDKDQLEAYFMKYAQYMEDSPNKPYVIRVGSRTLFGNDTMDLRNQFEVHVRKLKRGVTHLESKN